MQRSAAQLASSRHQVVYSDEIVIMMDRKIGNLTKYFLSTLTANIDTERWTVMTGDPQLATISITNLQTSDSNVFQCIATNKYKEELTSVVLNVVCEYTFVPWSL